MKNTLITIFFAVILFTTSFSQSIHSLGVETGYSIISGSQLSGESAPFYAIPYEYNWDTKSSFIIKTSFSSNRDFFIGVSGSGYDVFEFRTKINALRFSFSLVRKFGKQEKKFYGNYRIGLGLGYFLNGSYYSKQTYSYNSQYANDEKIIVGKEDLNILNSEIFAEFGIGVGFRINPTWSIELLRNNIISLTDSDMLVEPIFKQLKNYNYIGETRYRSFISGINVKLIYHFNKKE